MSLGGAVIVLAAAAGLALVPLWRVLLQMRRVRRLERTEAVVAGAVADGRLAGATGEALLQHLEGLRRECSGDNGS